MLTGDRPKRIGEDICAADVCAWCHEDTPPSQPYIHDDCEGFFAVWDRERRERIATEAVGVTE